MLRTTNCVLTSKGKLLVRIVTSYSIIQSTHNTIQSMRKNGNVFIHDLFNLISLIVIISNDVRYLCKATHWDHLGTSDLGKAHVDLANTLLLLFFAYIVIDTVWIAIVPSCVLSSPIALIVHHLLTFLFLLVPYSVPQFHWHGAVSIFVEVNVFFLVSRRQFLQGSLLYKILDFFFHLTWFSFRLVVFPFLLVFYSYEYARYSRQLGGVWPNIVVIAPVLQVRQLLFYSISILWQMDHTLQ